MKALNVTSAEINFIVISFDLNHFVASVVLHNGSDICFATSWTTVEDLCNNPEFIKYESTYNKRVFTDKSAQRMIKYSSHVEIRLTDRYSK